MSGEMSGGLGTLSPDGAEGLGNGHENLPGFALPPEWAADISRTPYGPAANKVRIKGRTYDST